MMYKNFKLPKKVIRFLLIAFVFGSVLFQKVRSQTVSYELLTDYDVNQSLGFQSSSHGIVLSSCKETQRATLSVETVMDVNFDNFLCSYNGPMNLYASYTDVVSDDYTHQSVDDMILFRKGFFGIIKCLAGSEIKSNNRKYYTSNTKTAHHLINNSWYFSNNSPKIDVRVILKLEGGLKLSDIVKLKTPGTGTLYIEDFVKKEGFLTSHECKDSNNVVCNKLRAIRRIDDLDRTDFIIQAHRGIWGKHNQENSMGAIVKARASGINLIESDIMPACIENIEDPNTPETFGIPSELVAFHDFTLKRLTNFDTGYVFNQSKETLKALFLKKPRSEVVGDEKILFFDELIAYCFQNDLILCVDMKSLESNGSNDGCLEMCEWQSQERKNQSYYHNIKWLLNNTDPEMLRNIVIKTYLNYDLLKINLTTGYNKVSIDVFEKVLWAPMIASGEQWRKSDGSGYYDPFKIQKFIDDWMCHNESVLYYETNFFNEDDNKTSVMLEDVFCYSDRNGTEICSNLLEYIYNVSGRRSGIFSEESVGTKGTVNRWGKWKIKNPRWDRRGDHLWLLKHPFFKHAVITTDRPDQFVRIMDL